MNKKLILIIVGVLVVLLILSVGVVAGVLIMKNSSKDSENQTADNQSVTSQAVKTEEEIFNSSIDNYKTTDTIRAEGVMTENSLEDEVQVTAMSKDVDSNYLYLSSQDEELSLISDVEGEITYVYVSDGGETVMFKIVEGEESEDIYDEVMENNPTESVEEVDDYDDPDYNIEYEGIEKCRDMQCHKYIVSYADSNDELIVWIDTEEELIRILKYETSELKGVFDVYYDNVDYELPEKYEEIKVETFYGIQKLYDVVGDFLDMFF